jgi:dienelactone hydrolase
MARWLAQYGIRAFVLRYRVAHTPKNDADMPAFLQNLFRVLPHRAPTVENSPVGTETIEQARTWAEEDGRQAIRFVRQHAAEWGVNRNRIGIAGFSAGGGVVMGAVMQHDAQSWPDFAAPIYAAYRTATPRAAGCASTAHCAHRRRQACRGDFRSKTVRGLAYPWQNRQGFTSSLKESMASE